MAGDGAARGVVADDAKGGAGDREAEVRDDVRSADPDVGVVTVGGEGDLGRRAPDAGGDGTADGQGP
ncbi:hypothetical protein GCM10025868_38890 [Angustibacter aerolatus]|uniref:Uncharacterized protein n=1 Tax=Angustibacter aerolatus TaxID=1162965 RepID=A0ABQ6JNE7_9ACTN|nr:hypothetical protein GCM10025868_38890 [Angustibacter aerolatus]